MWGQRRHAETTRDSCGQVLYIGTGRTRCASNAVSPKTGQSPYAEIEFRKALSRDPEPGRLGRVPARRHRRAGAVQPGRGRHPRPEVFPQGRRAGAAEEGRGERRPLLAVALGPRRGRARQAARGRALRLRDRRPPGLRPARRHLDLLGLEGRLLRHRGGRAAPSSTSSPSCSPPSASRRTRRNGSTPASTGPMASTAPARAISTSTPSPAS